MQHENVEIRFLANYLMNSCANAAKRLLALEELVNSEHSVRSGWELGTIVIDGNVNNIVVLDSPEFNVFVNQ